MLKAVDLLILSLWIAICAVTPEFIWRGARIAIGHMDRFAWAAAVLFGLILAFCIEPGLERLRQGWRSSHGKSAGHRAEDNGSSRLLFTAAEGLVFAIVSLCLHDSISTVLGTNAETEAERQLGLINGLTLTIAWSAVPFFVTLAWTAALTTRLTLWRWLALGLAIAAPVWSAWVFDWSWRDWVTTQIPALIILVMGYRQLGHYGEVAFFRRAARNLCWIAALWLGGMGLFGLVMKLAGWPALSLYTHEEFWIDVRFYIGWVVGLMVIPKPPPP